MIHGRRTGMHRTGDVCCQSQGSGLHSGRLEILMMPTMTTTGTMLMTVMMMMMIMLMTMMMMMT
eukprot:10980838-Karenia_brevis.AAC.1